MSPAVTVPSTDTIPIALLDPWNAIASRVSALRVKMPGFAGTIVAATGVVAHDRPPPCSDRTYALMLVVSFTSHGICALIWVGETKNSGAGMPLKYTLVPPVSSAAACCVRVGARPSAPSGQCR